MAKKIVRGITDVKTINNQDFDTNNVNDLLSDGQYNYIHRKKGENEEYHNLTDNIKTLSSDNTELLSVTNNNKTTNTATLHPKHDAQKEQLLESTRDTITINHGTNGTAEKTTVDTNPQKVLEHENLLTNYGISKKTSGNTTKLGLEYTKVEDNFDLNNLFNGYVKSDKFTNSPQNDSWFFVHAYGDGRYTIQEAVALTLSNNKTFRRLRYDGVWGEWRLQAGDKSVIDGLLAQKQDTLISDSEYITLDHQTGENKTHIKTESLKQELQQLHQTKQDTLTAGDGITIEGQTISATGGGASSSILHSIVQSEAGYAHAIQHVVTSGDDTLRTFSFQCAGGGGDGLVLTGVLKEELSTYVYPGDSISNGAITITNDGTTMKLINSSPSENVSQHATFTFYTYTGGGDLPPIVGS